MKIKSSMILLVFATLAVNLHAASSALPAPLPEFMNQQQLATWNAEHASARQTVASAQETSTQFYTGKPYVADAGGYVYKYRTYNPEMSRWTSADPSGFPDGANNASYVPNPTAQLDSVGLDTLTVSGSGTKYDSLTNVLTTPSNWSHLESNGAPTSLNAMIAVAEGSSSYTISATITYDTSTGAWGPAPTPSPVDAQNKGNTLPFTGQLGNNSATQTGSFKLTGVKISMVGTQMTYVKKTPYVPGTSTTSATMATITYKMSFTAAFTEEATLATSSAPNADPGAQPQDDISITFVE